MTDPMGIGTDDTDVAGRFFDWLTVRIKPRVLELGTLRSDPSFPTHHRRLVPEDADYIMSDIQAGQDVDVVADAHDLDPFDDNSFDAVIAIAVWEHLRRPWVACEALERVLRPGGAVYVCTHQTFPLHGYPSDFFRFSREALSGIMADAGLQVMDSSYAYRCVIEPPPEITRWNRAPDVEAWLNVDVMAVKPG